MGREVRYVPTPKVVQQPDPRKKRPGTSKLQQKKQQQGNVLNKLKRKK